MILPGNINIGLPKIVYHEKKGHIIISGRSTSLEVEKYLKEFIEYFLITFHKFPCSITLEIDLDYINTQARVVIRQFLRNLKDIFSNSDHQLTVKWIYESDDEELREDGEEYSSSLGIPFIFISREEN